MCGILGYVGNYLEGQQQKLQKVTSSIKSRWNQDLWLKSEDSIFYYSRLATDGWENISHEYYQKNWKTFLFNGLLVNKQELISVLELNSQQNERKLFREWIEKDLFKMLACCDGMFAWIYSNKEKLYLFRDLLGIKPLYFVKEWEWLYVSSLVQPLFDLGYKSVYNVPKQSCVIYTKWTQLLHKQKYYIQRNLIDVLMSPLEYLKQRVVTSAITYLNDFPDKKIAIALSGGLDSSLLYKILLDGLGKKYYWRVVSINVGQQWASDALYAKRLVDSLSRELGYSFEFVQVSPLKEMSGVQQALCELVYITGSNHKRVLFPSLLTLQIAKKLQKMDINVVYSGQGMDELTWWYMQELEKIYSDKSEEELLTLHEQFLYWDYEKTLLLRDDRVFGNFQIENRPVPSFPQFIDTMKCFERWDLLKYKRIVKQRCEEVGLPDFICEREKVRYEDWAYSHKSPDIFSFALEWQLENELWIVLDEYLEKLYSDMFNGLVVNDF